MAFDPARAPLVLPRYGAPTIRVFVTGIDLTGATMRLQIRDRWNGGMLRADLVNVVTPLAQGIRLVRVETIAGKPRTELEIAFSKATMTAMPIDQANPDGPARLVYDLVAERVAGRPELLTFGPVSIREGSTQ